VKGRKPYRLARDGLAHVPEDRSLFFQLTVRENLKLGAAGSKGADISQALDFFPALAPLMNRKAGLLSGGEQQMLAMGRALMATPRILLLDEPSMGLAPNLVELIFETIVAIHRAGTAIMLVEQNASQALAIADRGYVLQTGRIVLADSAAGLAANENVRRSYLGEI
jgi:branched-chain amino acid transport system ATP-binding protein